MTSVRLERWIARKFRLRHIELIAALYECRSILKASRRLNLTQPTLSKALQDVEATLGLSLFERTNRGLEPTPYGEIFARHAKIVLAQLRHAARAPAVAQAPARAARPGERGVAAAAAGDHAAASGRARVPRSARVGAPQRDRIGVDPHQSNVAAQIRLDRRDALSRGAG